MCRAFPGAAYFFPSRSPDPHHLAVLARSDFVGALATLSVTTPIGLPPALPSCCDRIGVEGLSPPLESTAPHGALNGSRILTSYRQSKIDRLGFHHQPPLQAVNFQMPSG
jgi:hypothetical protein